MPASATRVKRTHLVAVMMSGLLLGVFGVLGAALVGLSHDGTAARIAANEREALLHQLRVLVPAEQIDNDMLADAIEVTAPALLGTTSTRVYRARNAGEPVAAVLSPVVTQGYNGAIALIVAIRNDGSLAGVRVLTQRETPGLGDKIEIERSDWVRGFDGRSLGNPADSGWKVKRDGGVFDQFTGATITPRAVVRGVKNALDYFNENRTQLFAAPSIVEAPHG
ncbi:MAG: electron transport complex subunit RsxG [Gammaproteobacteria bacterium]|nr:electron transport complex subunit RsxG [Gammaproteobacteria bacterium]MCB1922548.1 electron transport complex subunit RsxG [Gammaproteobacteria bacterium]